MVSDPFSFVVAPQPTSLIALGRSLVRIVVRLIRQDQVTVLVDTFDYPTVTLALRAAHTLARLPIPTPDVLG